MKKHNIEIVKTLLENVTPMNKFALMSWLDANLIASDISATVSGCVDGRGFVAHEVILSDNHGADRRFTVPVLSDSFTFEENGIYDKYVIISPNALFGNKNMYIIAHKDGRILVSCETMICFYHFENNIVYFKRDAFSHTVTTRKHISAFLANFVNADALKMFAK